MAEPGFDANDPDFMKFAEALRGLDRKSVVVLGLSGRHIVGWSTETAQVLKLWDKLRVISAV